MPQTAYSPASTRALKDNAAAARGPTLQQDVGGSAAATWAAWQQAVPGGRWWNVADSHFEEHTTPRRRVEAPEATGSQVGEHPQLQSVPGFIQGFRAFHSILC